MRVDGTGMRAGLALLALPLFAAAADATNIELLVEAAALRDAVAPPMDRGTTPAFVAGVPGVALRSQGYGAPQADLSIRGAAFSSSGLLLSGIPLRNPQTEHFQADLPVPYDVFTEPTLLTGVDQFRTSSGHPAGSVALNLAPLETAQRVEAGGGPGNLFSSLRFCRREALDGGGSLGAAAFAESASVDRTDSRGDNDLARWSAGAQLQATSEANRFDLLGAYGWRRFGARGFYGAPATLPSEEELREALLVGAATLDSIAARDGTPTRLSASWQQTDDRYWLDRNDHGLYANHTASDIASLHGDTRRDLSQACGLDLRADADAEWMDGRYEGTLPSYGLGRHQRAHLSLAALPRYTVGDWTATAGGSAELFTDDRPGWLPAAAVTWRPSQQRRVTLSYTEALRQPSYTELNYDSPGSLGNNGLDRQRTRTLELAWRETRAGNEGGLALFAEDGENLVDWVRNTPGGRWTAANLENVRTYGLVADAKVPLARSVTLFGSYQVLSRVCSTNVLASRYVLDYPQHTIRLGMQARLLEDLAFACWQECAVYAANPARRGPDTGLAANAELRWQVWSRQGLEVAAGILNPWGSDFETYPGQPPAGRRFYASMRRTW
jgi:iron complex outermembrane receptor protein